MDILEVTPELILEKFGKPDVIWAAFDCTTFSLAAISKHRRKNEETGNLDPISEYAKYCDKVNAHTLELIKALDPKYFFIENPVGGLCSMSYMQGIPKHMITYCKYGSPY
jgi:site-specific DNA-cytosine methylase